MSSKTAQPMRSGALAIMATMATTAALATLLLTATAGAQEAEPAKEAPPPGGEPKDFSLPEKESFGLENGLEATLVGFGTLPKATVSVVVRAGNLNEGGQTWLADLAGDFLLEGTASRSAAEIARQAAAMGGQVNVEVGADRTIVQSDVLKEYAPQMTRLLADIVRNAAFPASELERLKRDRQRQLSIAGTQPQQMALAAFRNALYGDHPYGNLLPEAEQLAAYTLEDARGFYAENYGARRTHVYVAGQFDRQAVSAAIRESFGDWAAGPEILVDVPEPAEGKVAVDIIDRPGASQSNLYLGLPVPDPSSPDWIPLQVTNTLLGGFFSSRITSNIREDKGYTYSPYSTLSSRYRDAYWAEVAAVTTEVTGPAIEEIMGEVARLQSAAPPVEELDGVKNYTAGTFVLQNSTRGGIINLLAYQELHELPDSYLTDYVSNVFAVTPEDVSETAELYLREEDMTVVVVGDRSQIAEQVAPWVGGDEED
ncbi:M16 family metallopeptidase [Lentisalinibacter salinarum]|uniref:M16 family metallopeptidase n=1 Tax=Lentisalinibacter salinarum TaxID=2992239 RepID=UPI00386721A9